MTADEVYTRRVFDSHVGPTAGSKPPQLPRFYSEREHPLGPPAEGFDVGPGGEPLLGARDQRVWVSIEWAAEHGVDVPDDWREQS